MIAELFVDTNILIYAGSQSSEDQIKREKALKILRAPQIGFSAQVLQEYYEVAYRKKRLALSYEEVIRNLRVLCKRPVISVTAQTVLTATMISEHNKISYWDAAIIAAAQELGCHTIYSEDLNHGQKYQGIQVINPFKENED